jgi:hypothetical protein
MIKTRIASTAALLHSGLPPWCGCHRRRGTGQRRNRRMRHHLIVEQPVHVFTRSVWP